MSFNRASIDEKITDVKKSTTIVRLIKYLFKKEVAFVLVLYVLSSLIISIIPLFTAYAIDNCVALGDFNKLLVVASIMLALLTIWFILKYFSEIIMNKNANTIVLQIREEVFANLQTLGLYYFDSRPKGKILARLVTDISALKAILKQLVVSIVPNIFYLIFITVSMFLLNVKLAISAFLSLPIIVIGIYVIMTFSYKYWQLYLAKKSNLSAMVHEAYSGMKVIQSFSAENETKKEFNTINKEVVKFWNKAIYVIDIRDSVINMTMALGYAAIFYTAIFVIDIKNIGEIIAFISYVGLFWQPIRAMDNTYNQLANALAGASRVFELIDEKSELKEIDNPQELKVENGSVKFENISFAYPDEKDRIIVENINFNILSGQRVALVGPTGAGKTTIINLIARFYDPIEGRVLIDNQDIKNVSFDSLRNCVGLMTQESYIFSGTLLDNLKYGNENATEEEVLASCAAIGILPLINKIGLNTFLDIETLSGGQKQLIALVRLLLSNPKILILDEATSAIDTHSEILVQKGIASLMQNRTSFVVAHRLSTIKNADIIMYVDEKQILEMGSHAELYSLKGKYYNLYKSQFV